MELVYIDDVVSAFLRHLDIAPSPDQPRLAVQRTFRVTLGDLARRRGWKLHHYRDRHGSRQVDVDAVIETDDAVIPIALAYRADTGPDEIQDLYSFIAKHKCGHGFILTQGTTKKRIRETFDSSGVVLRITDREIPPELLDRPVTRRILDSIDGQDLMIVVDACVLGGKPGELRLVEPELKGAVSASTSVHQIGPLESLTIARKLYPEKLPLRILLILVETHGADPPTLDAAADDAVAAIDREIDSWQAQTADSGAAHP